MKARSVFSHSRRAAPAETTGRERRSVRGARRRPQRGTRRRERPSSRRPPRPAAVFGAPLLPAAADAASARTSSACGRGLGLDRPRPPWMRPRPRPRPPWTATVVVRGSLGHDLVRCGRGIGRDLRCRGLGHDLVRRGRRLSRGTAASQAAARAERAAAACVPHSFLAPSLTQIIASRLPSTKGALPCIAACLD